MQATSAYNTLHACMINKNYSEAIKLNSVGVCLIRMSYMVSYTPKQHLSPTPPQKRPMTLYWTGLNVNMVPCHLDGWKIE